MMMMMMMTEPFKDFPNRHDQRDGTNDNTRVITILATFQSNENKVQGGGFQRVPNARLNVQQQDANIVSEELGRKLSPQGLEGAIIHAGIWTHYFNVCFESVLVGDGGD